MESSIKRLKARAAEMKMTEGDMGSTAAAEYLPVDYPYEQTKKLTDFLNRHAEDFVFITYHLAIVGAELDARIPKIQEGENSGVEVITQVTRSVNTLNSSCSTIASETLERTQSRVKLYAQCFHASRITTVRGPNGDVVSTSETTTAAVPDAYTAIRAFDTDTWKKIAEGRHAVVLAIEYISHLIDVNSALIARPRGIGGSSMHG